MYNKDGFIIDDRPTSEYTIWRQEPCMTNCKEIVEVTMRASVFDVTPDEETSQLETINTNAATIGNGLDAELVANGEKVFAFCKVCHQVGPGAKNGIGPHLNNVYERKFGGIEDYQYSKVFQDAFSEGRVWNDKTMAEFLQSPLTYMAGTKMGFGGVQDGQDLTALMEYLKSLDE